MELSSVVSFLYLCKWENWAFEYLKGNNNVATILAKTACTVITIPLVNLIAIDIILSIRDFVSPFEVPVKFIAAKMLSTKNKPTIVG